LNVSHVKLIFALPSHAPAFSASAEREGSLFRQAQCSVLRGGPGSDYAVSAVRPTFPRSHFLPVALFSSASFSTPGFLYPWYHAVLQPSSLVPFRCLVHVSAPCACFGSYDCSASCVEGNGSRRKEPERKRDASGLACADWLACAEWAAGPRPETGRRPAARRGSQAATRPAGRGRSAREASSRGASSEGASSRGALPEGVCPARGRAWSPPKAKHGESRDAGRRRLGRSLLWLHLDCGCRWGPE